MKKIMFFLLICIIFLNIPKVNAASINLTSTTNNMTAGESATITLNINAAAWSIDLSGGISGKEEGGNQTTYKNVPTTKTYNFQPTLAGTYTITATGYVLDENKVIYGSDGQPDALAMYSNYMSLIDQVSKSVTIIVTPQQTNNNSNNHNTDNNTNSNSNNNASNNSLPKEETKKSDEAKTIEEDTKKTTDTVIGITKFEIEGYELDFDEKTLEYTIDIEDNIKKINIIVEGQNITTIGTGEVNIELKDSIKVIVKKGEETLEYIINFKRNNTNITKNNNNITNPIVLKKQINAFSIIVPLIGIITLIAIIIVLIKRIKIKKSHD